MPDTPAANSSSSSDDEDVQDVLADLNRVEGLLDAMTPQNRRAAGAAQ